MNIIDVVAVIDSGKSNQTQYDSNTQMVSLVESWISQANAQQRKGRAGRVQEGIVY